MSVKFNEKSLTIEIPCGLKPVEVWSDLCKSIVAAIRTSDELHSMDESYALYELLDGLQIRPEQIKETP